MPTATNNSLPLTETLSPASQSELAGLVRSAYGSGTAMYPLGGGNSLQYGLAATQSGWGISLEQLHAVIDYPARDMTITVEAGIRMADLAHRLAAENQYLPIDVAQADTTTLGGVIATNFSGPRRYGQGTVRDYVIGISAVDGRGTPFQGGGRVVKNVAGYDFCKLLTGSLGTLAIITQVTLKVKPRPVASTWVICPLANGNDAEPLLGALVNSQTMSTAIELLAGPAWRNVAGLDDAPLQLAVGLEGGAPEVDWMRDQLLREWRELGATQARALPAEQTTALWSALTEFAAQGAPLVLKFNVLPSAVASLVELVRQLDAAASIQAHAGNGIVLVRMSQFSPGDASQLLVKKLQPAAARAGGSVTVWHADNPGDLTRQAIWGPTRAETAVMRRVKQQFDPKNLLNPGRFVYGA